MHKYVGITIGPIFDTIMDATSPAALWFASSLFSDAARRICSEIKNVFSDAIIYSPYFGPDIQIDDGIGKFHDRIIFSTEGFDSEQMKKLILKVKRDTLTCFPEKFVNSDAVVFLEQYLQMNYVALEEEELKNRNCILVLSSYLDLLELMKSFPEDNASNVIRNLFCGEENGGNIYIKKSPLFKRIRGDSNQLKKDGSGLWTIGDIACDHEKINEKLKRKDYYAVVQADGDNMGKFLETLNHYAVTEFSRACLKYDEKACKEIGNFGGMTIYAGGDDLLFLSPVINAKGESVFELCARIGKLFYSQVDSVDSLKGNPCIPTVSFGIAVQHKKYPLYEALARGRELLDLAKKSTPQKNSMVIEVLKHSGRSIMVSVPNQEHEILQRVLDFGKEDEKTVHSVIYTLLKFEKLIFVLNHKARKKEIDECEYEHAFMNFFDNPKQIYAKDYLKRVCNTYWKYFVSDNPQICMLNGADEAGMDESERIDDNNAGKPTIVDEYDKSLKTYLYLLQIKKFLIEKVGEEY